MTCQHCLRVYRAITRTHLVHIHHYDPDHPMEEYKARFGLPYATCRDSIDGRVEVRNRTLEAEGKRWTRERIRRTLRQRLERGLPVNVRAILLDAPNLWNAARRRYGSWSRTLRAVGLEDSKIRLRRKNWTRKRILAEIRRRFRAGQDLNYASQRRRDSGFMGSAEHRFGAWHRALRAAGFDPDRFRKTRRWNRRMVLTSLKCLRGSLRSETVRKRDSGLVWAATKAFGSWESALRTAGFQYSEKRLPPKWPRRRVLSEIRRRKRLMLSIQDKVVVKDAGGLLRAAYREFGSWRAAVRAAGVAYPGRQRWHKETVVAEIRRRERTSLPVNPGAVNRSQPGLYDAGIRIFGTWSRAVTAARK